MDDQGDALLYLKPVSEMKFSRLFDDCSIAALSQLAKNRDLVTVPAESQKTFTSTGTRHTSSQGFAKHRGYYGRPLRTVSATGSFKALPEINGSSEGLLRE